MVQSPRLLVVDDEPAVLDLLVSCLSDTGYLVDQAPGVAEALRLIGAHDYDVAVVDKNMRGITTVNEGGIEIVRELHERLPACGVLAITGYPDETELAAVMETGARGWMAKPFMLRELLQRVEQLVEQLADVHSNRNHG